MKKSETIKTSNRKYLVLLPLLFFANIHNIQVLSIQCNWETSFVSLIVCGLMTGMFGFIGLILCWAFTQQVSNYICIYV